MQFRPWTMALSKPLADIDDKFLTCSICLDQFKQPKILPCLHRYCRHCLSSIDRPQRGLLQCPECREDHPIPPEGVDGFRNDFNTQNIVEFVQLQNTVANKPRQECAECTNEERATEYCFVCQKFLCPKCHISHLSEFKDHQPLVISMTDVESRALTWAEVASLRDDTQCCFHSTKVAELCCVTCRRSPICMECATSGRHRSHDIRKISSLAQETRATLYKKLRELTAFKERLYKKRDALKEANSVVANKNMEILSEYEREGEAIQKNIRKNTEEFEEQKSGLAKKYEKHVSSKKQELDDIIKRATEEYEKTCQGKRNEIDSDIQKLTGVHRNLISHFVGKLRVLNEDTDDLTSLEKSEDLHVNSSRSKLDDLDYFVKKFENAITVAESILTAAKHDWKDVHSSREACAAIDPLIEKMKGKFLEIEPPSGPSQTVLAKGMSVYISEESVKIPRCVSRRTDSISGSNDRLIITSGSSRSLMNVDTYLAVVGGEGDEIRYTDFEGGHHSYCAAVTDFKIAVASYYTRAIGIYDIRHGSYVKAAGTGDRITGSISCIAADSPGHRIMVGCEHGRNVCEFDFELKYIRTLTLPDDMKWPRDICIHGNLLGVCDYDGGKAFAVKMESSSTVAYEFTEPREPGSWWPCSVCTDRNGFVYVLWYNSKWFTANRRLLVQYSPDGGRQLHTRKVDADAWCIATVEADRGEKLLVATYSSGKLASYELIAQTNTVR